MDGFLILGFLSAAYFAPTVIAITNKAALWPICLLVNLFFGWTIIGWFAAIVIGVPTKEDFAYRAKVKKARDDFYLREAEKAR